mgnify:CR=1 FL=1
MKLETDVTMTGQSECSPGVRSAVPDWALHQHAEVSSTNLVAADLPAWYELYRQTARRDRITLHDYEYYRRQFELAQAGGSAAGGAPAGGGPAS